MTREGINKILVFGRIKYKEYSWIILAAGIFIIAFIFFLYNIHLLSLSPGSFASNDLIIGSDSHDIANSMRGVSFGGDMQKHVLFSATTAPLVSFIRIALHINENRSIRLVLALISALNITGVFLLLRKFFSATRLALLFTFLYIVFFSNLVIFSIPETYSLSNLIFLIYLFVFLKVRETFHWRYSLVLSFLAGFAALYNPPMFSIIIIHIVYYFHHSKFKFWVKLALVNLVFGAFIFLSVNYLIHGLKFITYFRTYSSNWASLNNLLDLRILANVIVSFCFYSILSPVSHLPATLELQNISGYFQSPLGLVLFPIIVFGIFYGFLIAIIKNSKYQRLTVSLLPWILLMILFYTYFDPKDAILFSSQILLPILIILANTFETIRIKPSIKYYATLIVCALLAVNNFLCFYSGPGK
jgi:hypothetical protein